MVLDAIVDKESVTISIENPFRSDIDDIADRIEKMVSSKGATAAGLDLKGLIPRMIKGIAGCESGCPADAKRLVSKGFKGFDLEYIEGGILSARTALNNGSVLYLKLFPDF